MSTTANETKPAIVKLKHDAAFRWHGRFLRKDLIDSQATHVKVTVVWDFVVGPRSQEAFWCKIIAFGKGRAHLTCAVDNDMEFTEHHGLKLGDLIKVDPIYVFQTINIEN